MSETKIANRYAQALLQEAQTANQLSNVATDMLALGNACKNSTDLRNALKNPIISPQQKLNALNEIFKGFNKITLDFFKLVCSRNRESILASMSDEFMNIYRANQGIVKVNVQSAVAINDTDRKSIEDYVKKSTNAKTVEIETAINPDIIGGMIIKFGDNLLDTSISAKLRKLKKELNIA